MDGSPPSSFEAFEGDYIHPNTTTRFTATLSNRFKFKFKYTMQLRDERKTVELCTVCMCFHGNGMSIPVSWKEGLSPTAEAALKQKTAASRCRIRHSCHPNPSPPLIFNHYKVGKQETRAIDMRQFAPVHRGEHL